MAINSTKLLPGSKTSTTSKGTAQRMASAFDRNLDMLIDSAQTPSKSLVGQGKKVLIIKTQVIKIENLIKRKYVEESKRKKEDDKNKEKLARKKREEKLEEKPKQDEKLSKVISLPKMGFLDGIKNFLVNLVLGFVAFRLIEHLPKIVKFARILAPAVDFFIDFSGKLLDGLITFIDWGYKAYDATRGFVKTMGGNTALKIFDGFNDAVGKVIDAAIIASIALSGMGDSGGGGYGGGGGKRGFDTTGRRIGKDAQKRYFQRYGRERFIERFGEENLKNLPKSAARSGLTKVARKSFVGLVGKAGAKAVLGFAKPLLKRLPIIGGLIDFGLSVALGEDPGRAAFKAIGATLVGAIGAAIGSLAFGAGAIIGGIIGGIGGDMLGGALYDMFFGGKKPTPKGKTAKAAGGGQATRGGKLVGSKVKRSVKKQKTTRTVKVTPESIKPGKDIGGKIEIEKIFPESKQKDTISSLGYLSETSNTLGKAAFFGPLFSIALKTILGDKPNNLDYKNVGIGLNAWLSRTLSSSGGFAGGGEVDTSMFMNGEDYSNVIASSVKDSVSYEIDKTIKDLMNQLGLKPSKGSAGVPGAGSPGSADMINIQGGDADFWTLVAVASREDGEPQAWADVAQSIYNRLASGAYSGKTIKDLILGQMQYEPTWKFPKPGATGKPNSEWYAIKDAASAGVAAGQSEEAMKKVAAAILDPTLQKNAREFIQGRTDFRGYSVSGGVQRKSGDNYYGWYNNYTANKIGSVPNFGATASTGPGPADGGILGSGKVGAVEQFNPIAKQFGLQITSDYRPGDSGYHGKNRARDYSNDGVGSGTPQQLKFAQYLVKNYGSSITQLIYTPLGYGIANGKKVGLDYWGASTNSIHYNHVHVAMAKGGLVGGMTHTLLGERGPEYVLDSDTTLSLNTNMPGFLDKLNRAKNIRNIMSVIQSYASYEDGAESEVVLPDNYGSSDESEDMMPKSSQFVPVPMGGSGSSDPFAVLDRLPG